MIQHYRVTGEASPQLVPRILDVFARCDLLVDTMVVRRTGDRLAAALTARLRDETQAEIILQRICALVLVEAADRRAVRARRSIRIVDMDDVGRHGPRRRASANH